MYKISRTINKEVVVLETGLTYAQAQHSLQGYIDASEREGFKKPFLRSGAYAKLKKDDQTIIYRVEIEN